MKHLASLIVKVLSNLGDEKTYQKVREEVEEISSHFPIPGLDS
jgi:glycine/serine hydroxymethyltransferase